MKAPGALSTDTVTTWIVSEKDSGKRLDRFLADHVGALGRRGIKRLFLQGKVRIGGRIARKSLLLVSEMVVQIELGSGGVLPESESPLTVLFQSASFVAVNKPAGQATLPLATGERGTLANALVARFPECATVGGAWDAGFVHRLDHFTSGVLLAARSEAAWRALVDVLRSGQLVKRYIAIVVGDAPESGVIERAILPSRRSLRRVVLANPSSETSVLTPRRTTASVPTPRRTTFSRIERRPGYSLLEVDVSRAYRHQIRAHLASIGCPIAGDRVYGFGQLDALGERHALHASYAAFAGGAGIREFEVRAPMPADMLAFWDGLRA